MLSEYCSVLQLFDGAGVGWVQVALTPVIARSPGLLCHTPVHRLGPHTPVCLLIVFPTPITCIVCYSYRCLFIGRLFVQMAIHWSVIEAGAC